MTLSKKNRKEAGQQTKPALWERLSGIIDKKKHQLAEFLGRQSEKLTPQGKKLSLLFFGIVMGGISLALIVKSFRDSPTNAYGFSKEISKPIFIIPLHQADSMFSREDYEVLLGFKQTIDSLKRYDPTTYEELLKGREGLVDSINFLISIYQ